MGGNLAIDAILDGHIELERALLDHEMRDFKIEIDRKLSSFSQQKEQLLSLLFTDYDQSRPPDDYHDAWSRIETTAYKYFARQVLKQSVTESREARYRAISTNSKRARERLEKGRDLGRLSRNKMKEWLEGTKGLTEATNEFSDQLYDEVGFVREIEKAIKSLRELETAANEAANGAQKGRGRPRGTSLISWNYIYALAIDYQRSTGRRAGAGSGPFARFVCKFLEAVGQSDFEPESLIDAIKSTRTKVRRRIIAGESLPFPFFEEA